eukprot:jgi/Botrbrau1/10635/Bobra.154_1s0024.1
MTINTTNPIPFPLLAHISIDQYWLWHLFGLSFGTTFDIQFLIGPDIHECGDHPLYDPIGCCCIFLLTSLCWTNVSPSVWDEKTGPSFNEANPRFQAMIHTRRAARWRPTAAGIMKLTNA